jgi:hypothetical protein
VSKCSRSSDLAQKAQGVWHARLHAGRLAHRRMPILRAEGKRKRRMPAAPAETLMDSDVDDEDFEVDGRRKQRRMSGRDMHTQGHGRQGGMAAGAGSSSSDSASTSADADAASSSANLTTGNGGSKAAKKARKDECEHGRQRSKCKECGGSSLCEQR